MNGTNKENKAREIIALMLRLAKEDQNFHEKEFYYILQVADSMGIKPEELREIQLNLDGFHFDPPKNEPERMTVLYYMLFCMKSDRKVTKEEIKLVQRMGFRLGFREQLTDDLIRTIIDHSNKSLPAEKLLDNLKKYMN